MERCVCSLVYSLSLFVILDTKPFAYVACLLNFQTKTPNFMVYIWHGRTRSCHHHHHHQHHQHKGAFHMHICHLHKIQIHYYYSRPASQPVSHRQIWTGRRWCILHHAPILLLIGNLLLILLFISFSLYLIYLTSFFISFSFSKILF